MKKFFRKVISALARVFRRVVVWIERELIGGSAMNRPLLIRNEILKLRAQSADRLSTACFSIGAAGVIAPLFSSAFQHDAAVKVNCVSLPLDNERYLDAFRYLNAQCTSPWSYTEILLVLLIVCIWLIMGFVLHLIGEAFLLKLGEK